MENPVRFVWTFVLTRTWSNVGPCFTRKTSVFVAEEDGLQCPPVTNSLHNPSWTTTKRGPKGPTCSSGYLYFQIDVDIPTETLRVPSLDRPTHEVKEESSFRRHRVHRPGPTHWGPIRYCPRLFLPISVLTCHLFWTLLMSFTDSTDTRFTLYVPLPPSFTYNSFIRLVVRSKEGGREGKKEGRKVRCT